jgi:hypothetical protein
MENQMPETRDLLTVLRDVGVTPPAAGDAGDARVRSALDRAIDGRRRSGRRLRLPFGAGSIALVPAGLLVTAIAAAATVTLVNASPTILFTSNPQSSSGFGRHQTVIRSTIRKIATVHVPSVGPIQYWIADTKQHGQCWGLRSPNGSWLALSGGGSGGLVPGCGPTRKQMVLAQGNSSTGLLPTSVDEASNSIKAPDGQWWDIYYGAVTADGAAAVRDQTTGKTARLIDGQNFILVERQPGRCSGCDDLRAVNAAGQALPANYGPRRYRDH